MNEKRRRAHNKHTAGEWVVRGSQNWSQIGSTMSGCRFDTRYQLFFADFFVKSVLVLGNMQSYRWVEGDESCSKPVSNWPNDTGNHLPQTNVF